MVFSTQLLTSLRFALGAAVLTSSLAGFSPAFPALPTAAATIQFVLPNADPADRGTPPTQGGTGSRGNCLRTSKRPPLTQVTGGDRLNLTVSERPTIWVYVPYSKQEAATGEFSLQDGDDEVYRLQFPLPTAAGVVGISLPAQLTLDLEKPYRWYLDIDCPNATALKPNQFASVVGIVQRVAPSPDLQQQLAIAKTPVQRAIAYAKHGIWYDTIRELAQLRLREPSNAAATTAWVELLSDRAVGLNSVANATIVGMVTTSSQSK